MRTRVRGDGSFTFVVVIIVFVVVFLLTLHLSCFNQKKSVSVLNLLEVLISSNGFCFPTHKSVLCSFKKLSFNNTLIRNTIKKSFMECSFCIWLARNKNWTPSAALVSSMILQKKPLLFHLLNRPPNQCQMQGQFTLYVSSIMETRVMQILSCRS